MTSRGSSQSNDNPQNYSFGAVLRKLRTAADLQQIDLARRLHRSSSFLSLLESGSRKPTLDFIQEVISVLNIPEGSEEHALLLTSGGFLSDTSGGHVQQFVQTVANQTQMSEFDRLMVLSDLTTTVNSWHSLLKCIQIFYEGDFLAARKQLIELEKIQNISPTLRITIRMYLAQAQLQLGDLSRAEVIILQSYDFLSELESAPERELLLAEIQSIQGIIALRSGKYSLARNLIDQSMLIYDRLLQGASHEIDIAQQGLGRTYKRLAQVALFQGQPSEALKFCFSAESYFAKETISPPMMRNLWLRRTAELKAWAYSALLNVDKAIAIREHTRKMCEDAHDWHGSVKNALYYGDDLRRKIELRLESDVQLPWDSSHVRRDQLQNILASPDIRIWTDKAERFYRLAMEGLEKIDEKILLGRVYRSLAIILRFISVRDDNEDSCREARTFLNKALHLERVIGQLRRIPCVFAAFADLEWDWNHIDDAKDYLKNALNSLDSLAITANDPASDSLRQRISKSVGILDNTQWLVGDKNLQSGPILDRGATDVWRQVSQQLVDVVRTYLKSDPPRMIAQSPQDIQWCEMLLQIEKAPGHRLLAQNQLSSSLSMLIPAGYEPEEVTLHSARYEALRDQLMRAPNYVQQSINRDFCCRIVVKRSLENPDTRRLVHAQLSQAATYMHLNHSTYALESGEFLLPLGFYVKGQSVLLEIPERLAPYMLVHEERQHFSGDTLCFRLENAEMAKALTDLFQAIVKEATTSLTLPDTTDDWLQSILGKPTSPLLMAGKM